MTSNKKLKFIAANHEVCIWPLCMLGEMLKYHFYKLAGENHSGEMLGEWKNRKNRWAVDFKKYDKSIANKMIRKAEKDPKLALNIIGRIYKKSDALNGYTKKIFNSDLTKKTDKEILKLYLDFRGKYIAMYIYAWFPNSIEGKSGFFSSYLEEKLNSKLMKNEKTENSGEVLSKIISPTRYTNREKENIDLLKIAFLISNSNKLRGIFVDKNTNAIREELSRNFPFVEKLFIRHAKNYCWIPFDYDGPAWDMENFIKKVKEMVKKKNLKIEKELITQNKRNLRNIQKKYEIKIRSDKKLLALIKLARKLMYVKDYRKDALFKSYYHMDKLIREIGRRLSLSPFQVKHILPQEMEKVFLRKKFSVSAINDRIKYSVLLYKDYQKGIVPRKPIIIFTGEKAMKVVNKKVEEEKINLLTPEFKGQVAFLGKAQGNVKIISSRFDINKMNKGDVLVSKSTNPNLMPALKLASAIITDEGGITCHAAIVSRELGIPCVIGTKIATKVLKDGDLAEVDADKGAVKILKR